MKGLYLKPIYRVRCAEMVTYSVIIARMFKVINGLCASLHE
jgi:hypothetical protein